MDYLLTFPVINFEAYETHEPVYGALAEFFVRQTPREAQNQRFTALYPTDATPDDSLDRTHASAVYAAVLQCLFSTLAVWDHRAVKYAYTASKGNIHSGRTVKVVPLGSFYPEQISTPADAHDAHNTRLFTKEIPPARKTNNLWKKQASYLHLILQLMQDSSGQPNVYDYDCPTPMPPLQVFQFIARKYLGLRIAEDSCQIDGEYAAHEKLVRDPGMATVFTDNWPVEIPTFFDSVDGAGNYEAFFLGDDDE